MSRDDPAMSASVPTMTMAPAAAAALDTVRAWSRIGAHANEGPSLAGSR
jgi:hypothetical protein